MLRNSETKNRWKRRKKKRNCKNQQDCGLSLHDIWSSWFFITKYEMVTNLCISPRGSVPASTSPLTTEANYWRHTPSLIISYLDFRGRSGSVAQYLMGKGSIGSRPADLPFSK